MVTTTKTSHIHSASYSALSLYYIFKSMYLKSKINLSCTIFWESISKSQPLIDSLVFLSCEVLWARGIILSKCSWRNAQWDGQCIQYCYIYVLYVLTKSAVKINYMFWLLSFSVRTKSNAGQELWVLPEHRLVDYNILGYLWDSWRIASGWKTEKT